MDRRPTVLRWGPLLRQGQLFGGGIGGYARYNSQAERSFLKDAVELKMLPVTVPLHSNKLVALAYLPVRLIIDVVRVFFALLAGRYDVFHMTALYHRSIVREYFATILARFFKVPVFYDIRAGYFQEFYERANPIFRYMARFIMKNSHEITIQGRKHLDFVRKTFNRDVIWLPNCFLGADLRKYEPARISPIGDGEYFRISFVGYLIPDKGVDILLRATAELSKEMPIELTLIGHVSPEIEQELNLAKTRQSKNFKLNLTGRLEFHELLPLLQQSHMFVFNSRFFGEGHPNVINEAMAMGLPIVASTNGFLGDIVSDKNGGVVHDPKSVTELIEKIRKLSSDWETLRMKGKMARRLVEEVFVDEVVLKTTQNIYTRELSSDNRHQIEEHYQNWLRSD